MAKRLDLTQCLDTVDETTVNAAIEAKAIGKRIRRLRLKRSLGLVELGAQVGPLRQLSLAA